MAAVISVLSLHPLYEFCLKVTVVQMVNALYPEDEEAVYIGVAHMTETGSVFWRSRKSLKQRDGTDGQRQR